MKVLLACLLVLSCVLVGSCTSLGGQPVTPGPSATDVPPVETPPTSTARPLIPIDIEPGYIDEDKAAAEEAVALFHDRFNAEEFESIYDDAYEGFQQSRGKAELLACMRRNYAIFGRFQSIIDKQLDVIIGAPVQVRAIYTALFEKSDVTEVFVFYKVEGQMRLVLYAAYHGAADLNQVSFETLPPTLAVAAQSGNIAEAEWLLHTGEFVNQTTIDNQTPLHLAAAEGQDEMVRWLLAHEADPAAKDANGKTPADCAASHGHSQTAEIILDYIQLLQSETQAIVAGDRETLRTLLAQDPRGYTLLHIAAQLGAVQLAVDEISAGADVNAQTALGLTPLHKAVVSGNLKLCQALLRAGADVNARDVL